MPACRSVPAALVWSVAALGALASAGCEEGSGPTGVSPGIDRAGVVYRARFADLRPDVLDVEVEIANEGSTPRTVVFPDTCVVLLRAYFPRGALAWDQQEREKSCLALRVEVELAAGESRAFAEQIGSLGILGFELPEGDYRITTYLRPVDEPEVEIELGTVRLERPEAF